MGLGVPRSSESGCQKLNELSGNTKKGPGKAISQRARITQMPEF